MASIMMVYIKDNSILDTVLITSDHRSDKIKITIDVDGEDIDNSMEFTDREGRPLKLDFEPLD